MVFESRIALMKKPELLSPAGSLEHMRFAYAYGADAVYAGQPRYSLRVRNNEFGKDSASSVTDQIRSRPRPEVLQSNPLLVPLIYELLSAVLPT